VCVCVFVCFHIRAHLSACSHTCLSLCSTTQLVISSTQSTATTATPQVATTTTEPGKITAILTVEGSETAYSKDASHVYCQDRILPGADAKTFTAIYSVWTDSPTFNFAKDKNHVYSECSIISGADPATFSLINNDEGWTYAAKDKNNVYYDISGSTETPAALLPDADPATFTVFGDLVHGYAKDKNHVYRYDYQTGQPSILIDADPATFTPICKRSNIGVCDFSEDNKHVFYQATVAPGADPSTFSLLCFPPIAADDEYSCYYAKDKDHVFVLTGNNGDQIMQAIGGAVPATFTLVNPSPPCGPGCFIDAKDIDAQGVEHEFASGQIIF